MALTIFSGKQKLFFIDWIFFILNGVIWVDRKNKEDMAASKEAVLKYLAKNQSILWFPEGTWNLTPSQLMLPMKWGIIDIARQAGAQIIPMALDYNREKNLCRVKFGTPMEGESLENKEEAIRSLRDNMATLRWDFISEQSIQHRAETNVEQLKKDKKLLLERVGNHARDYLEGETVYDSNLIKADGLFLRTLYFNGRLVKDPVLSEWMDFLKNSKYVNAAPARLDEQEFSRESQVYYEHGGIEKINEFLKGIGISSIEEAKKICDDKGIDVYNLVKGIQPICFENACWSPC